MMQTTTSYGTTQDEDDTEFVTISTFLFPHSLQSISSEQVCGFEMVRLAFFALKLRKLEHRYVLDPLWIDASRYAFYRNLLQHAIFQQVLSLTRLGARKQALRLIEVCHQ
jgi:hypothetical protein